MLMRTHMSIVWSVNERNISLRCVFSVIHIAISENMQQKKRLQPQFVVCQGLVQIKKMSHGLNTLSIIYNTYG